MDLRAFTNRNFALGSLFSFVLGTPLGSWWMTYVTKDWDFWELFWPQIFRGIGMMLAIVPITNVALGTLNPNMLKNASGLFNLMRNLGGAVGLATINTVLNNRTDLHLVRLHEAVNWSRGPAVDTFNHLVAQLSDFGTDAKAMALKQLMLIVHRQAVVMAFADVFLILSLLFVALAALAIVMKRPTPATAEVGAH